MVGTTPAAGPAPRRSPARPAQPPSPLSARRARRATVEPPWLPHTRLGSRLACLPLSHSPSNDADRLKRPGDAPTRISASLRSKIFRPEGAPLLPGEIAPRLGPGSHPGGSWVDGHPHLMKPVPPKRRVRDQVMANPAPDSGDHYRRPSVGVVGMDQERARLAHARGPAQPTMAAAGAGAAPGSSTGPPPITRRKTHSPWSLGG